VLGKERTNEALRRMSEYYPDAKGELKSDSPFQLLVAVILSAQTTDAQVNKVTKKLFTDYPTAHSLANAELSEIEEDIKRIGLYHNKAKNIKATAKIIDEKYHGDIPRTHKELEELPGVGRKTANVVLGDGFGIPGIAVDTHVERVSKRLHIAKQDASVLEVEKTLEKKIPENLWVLAHHTIILFGRYHCTARNPKCENCTLLDLCLEGQKYLKVKEERKAK
jgi:endonuclease-3